MEWRASGSSSQRLAQEESLVNCPFIHVDNFLWDPRGPGLAPGHLAGYFSQAILWEMISLLPRPSHPVFVACSTSTGESLVKLITCSDVPGHWVDVWRSDTFLHSCKVAFWTQEILPRLSDVKRSIVLRSMFAISTALKFTLFFFWEWVLSPHCSASFCVTRFLL